MALRIQTFVSGPLQTNVYLLEDTQKQKAVIIDPSFINPQVQQAAEKMGESAVSFTAIWLTHAHLDHWHGSGFWQRKYNLPVYLHRDDQIWTEDPNEQAMWLNFPEPDVATVDHWMEENQALSVGEFQFQVIHTPGHSPGSVSFYCKEENLLIDGDVLFAGSVGRTDLPECDPAALRVSLRKLMALPPETQVLPGHGPSTTIEEEAENNPFCRNL
jgi:glyoxylase-like metal-dependent hydrolase (beta-lactamase superfamily II)